MFPHNHLHAQRATEKIEQLLAIYVKNFQGLKFLDLEDAPQQANGSDCGVYVCVQMKHLLLKRLLTANSKERVSMSMAGRTINARGGRTEMLKIINNFRREGERRRS